MPQPLGGCDVTTLVGADDRCPRCQNAACHSWQCLGSDGEAALRAHSRELASLIIAADALRWELTDPT